jgi:hypothetical protein
VEHPSASTASIIVGCPDRTYEHARRPDMLVRHGEAEETCPVDTKYELHDERRVAPEDIYQAFSTPSPSTQARAAASLACVSV